MEASTFFDIQMVSITIRESYCVQGPTKVPLLTKKGMSYHTQIILWESICS